MSVMPCSEPDDDWVADLPDAGDPVLGPGGLSAQFAG